MKKKLVSILLALVLMVNGGILVNADSFEDTNLSNSQLYTENLNKTFIDSTNQNIDVRKFKDIELKGSFDLYSKNNKLLTTTYSAETRDGNADQENTTPDNAKYFAYNSIVNGNIGAENEIRWYITQINEKSKSTIFLQLSQAETQNFDL